MCAGLFYFLPQTTFPQVHKWFARLVMKDLKVHMSDATVFNAYHPDAAEVFSKHTDLSRVCTELRDRDVRAQVFTSFFLSFSANRNSLLYRELTLRSSALSNRCLHSRSRSAFKT
jgi:hypothetical protein